MTSVLNVDTIADKAGTGPVSFTKQVGVKAFANQDNGTSLNKSFNVSSLTDNSTGRYELAITNAFTDANFGQMVCAGPAKEASCNIDTSHNTAAIMSSRIYRTDSSAYVDSGDCNYYGVGDLA
tara:strand:- start:33 stop:401 length:369 start_codon:yes stop_codon:yes gene_type:complete